MFFLTECFLIPMNSFPWVLKILLIEATTFKEKKNQILNSSLCRMKFADYSLSEYFVFLHYLADLGHLKKKKTQKFIHFQFVKKVSV